MSSIAFRESQPSDARFIRGAFLDSYRCAHAAGMIPMDNWDSTMGPLWDKILARPNIKTFVAYHPTEDDDRFDLYGFVVVDESYKDGNRALPFVVYCNVKHKYRRRGIATKLFRSAGIDPSEEFHYAAKTGVCSDPRVRARVPRAKWKPLAIRFEPKENL